MALVPCVLRGCSFVTCVAQLRIATTIWVAAVARYRGSMFCLAVMNLPETIPHLHAHSMPCSADLLSEHSAASQRT